MAETFDPYRKWLGIPASQQPPHHYRLLGVELYEDDVEVIDTAAAQRMSYLQEVGSGPYLKDSQRILNEVSAARRCLLDPKRKSQYDDALKAKLSAAAAPVAPPVAPPPLPRGRPMPPPVEPPVVEATPVERPIEIVGDFSTNAGSRAKTPGAKRSPATAKFIEVKPARIKSSPGKSPAGDRPSDESAEGRAGDRRESEGRASSRRRNVSLPMIAGLLALLGVAAGGMVFFTMRKATEPEVERIVPIAARPSTPKPQAAPSTDFTTPTSPAPASAAVAAPTGSTATTPSATGPTSPGYSFFDPPKSAAPATTAVPPAAVPTATAAAPVPADTAVAAATPSPTSPTSAPENTPAVTSAFFGLDSTVALPDARPHFVATDRSINDLAAVFRVGSEYQLVFSGETGGGRNNKPIWGRAVSADLFTWTSLPPIAPPVDAALKPELGSVFLDRTNAAALGKPDAPAWIAAFTYASQGDKQTTRDVGLAVSADGGATWTAHEANPVIVGEKPTARWPRLFRHEASKQWCLLSYSETVAPPAPATSSKSKSPPVAGDSPKSTYRLFTSPDLQTWTHRQDILFTAGAAPAELLDLAADGDAAKTQTMFLHGRGRYWLGGFDGERFTTERIGGALQSGGGFMGFRAVDGASSAETTLMPIVAADASGGASPGLAPAFPQRIAFKNGAIVPRRDPPPAAWSGTPQTWNGHELPPESPLAVTGVGSTFRIEAQVAAEQATELTIAIFGTPVQFDFVGKKCQIARRTAVDFATNIVQIDAVVDVDFVEATLPGLGFVAFRTDRGPDAVIPLQLKSVGGKARVLSLKVTPLQAPRPVAKP